MKLDVKELWGRPRSRHPALNLHNGRAGNMERERCAT